MSIVILDRFRPRKLFANDMNDYENYIPTYIVYVYTAYSDIFPFPFSLVHEI
jgi:hypothetical protein